MRRRSPEREDMEMTKSFKAILLAGAMIVAPFPAIAAAQEAPDAEVVADQAAAEDAAVSDAALANAKAKMRSEEHTSELQSLMRISYAVFCLKKKNQTNDYLINTVTQKHNH